jgi:hypothetical protein
MCKYDYNKLHRDPEKHKKNMKRWRENHPDYFKDYLKTKLIKDE